MSSFSTSVPDHFMLLPLFLSEVLKFLPPLPWLYLFKWTRSAYLFTHSLPCVTDKLQCTRTQVCVYPCVFVKRHCLLISALHPSYHHAAFKVINFFIRICQQSVLFCWEDNWIRLFSWEHAWGKSSQNVAFITNHQENNPGLLLVCKII